MREKDYCLGFSVFPGIGPGRFQSLLDAFSSVKEAYVSCEKDLGDVIGKKFASDFIQFREQFDIDAYKQKLSVKGVVVVTIFLQVEFLSLQHMLLTGRK